MEKSRKLTTLDLLMLTATTLSITLIYFRFYQLPGGNVITKIAGFLIVCAPFLMFVLRKSFGDKWAGESLHNLFQRKGTRRMLTWTYAVIILFSILGLFCFRIIVFENPALSVQLPEKFELDKSPYSFHFPQTISTSSSSRKYKVYQFGFLVYSAVDIRFYSPVLTDEIGAPMKITTKPRIFNNLLIDLSKAFKYSNSNVIAIVPLDSLHDSLPEADVVPDDDSTLICLSIEVTDANGVIRHRKVPYGIEKPLQRRVIYLGGDAWYLKQFSKHIAEQLQDEIADKLGERRDLYTDIVVDERLTELTRAEARFMPGAWLSGREQLKFTATKNRGKYAISTSKEIEYVISDNSLPVFWLTKIKWEDGLNAARSYPCM